MISFRLHLPARSSEMVRVSFLLDTLCHIGANQFKKVKVVADICALVQTGVVGFQWWQKKLPKKSLSCSVTDPRFRDSVCR